METFDEMQNPLEFLQIYTTAIQAAGGNDKVMANYMSTVLKGSARTWLFNQPKGSIYIREMLCNALQSNFKSCYAKPGKEDDLHRLRQTPLENLRQFVKRFIEVRNTIPNVSNDSVIRDFK